MALNSRSLRGVGASPGIGIGRAVIVRQEFCTVEKKAADPAAERERYRDAVQVFCDEIDAAGRAVARNAGEAEAEILRSQILFIKDPILEKQVWDLVDSQQINVDYAFSKACESLAELFAAMDDELMSARAADFLDMRARMLRILLGGKQGGWGEIPPGSILIAQDISPSQSALLDPDRISGIATAGGTKFAHISIIARALGIPAVVGVEGLLDGVRDGEELIVNGEDGAVLLSPSAEQRAAWRKKAAMTAGFQRPKESGEAEVAVTLDGAAVEVAANLALMQELPLLLESGADGVGLFRTEFLFMKSPALPSQEEQCAAYERIARELQGKPVVIRTLDAGGDKGIPSLERKEEENPALGMRGIRLSLKRKRLFQEQLAAILRAAVHGNIQIMIPMVTGVEELRQARQLLEEAKGALECKGVPCAPRVQLGVMIETPAAALCSGALAEEADFFCIGTNDLTQYTLAVDRGNREVAALYDHLHPAVLQLLLRAAGEAQKAGKPACVCGEAAADPVMIPLLLGMGITKLSVAPGLVSAVKELVRTLSAGQCRELAARAVRMSTAQEVRELIAGETG